MLALVLKLEAASAMCDELSEFCGWRFVLSMRKVVDSVVI